MHKDSAKQSPGLLTFLRYLRSEPGLIRVTGALPFVLVRELLFAGDQLICPLTVAYGIRYVLGWIIILLSAFTASGPAVIAMLRRAENKSRAVLALVIIAQALYLIVAIAEHWTLRWQRL